MTPDSLIPYFLWISLLLLLVSALARISRLAVVGWFLFAIFWLSESRDYYLLPDYFNVVLVLLASAFSFYMSWLAYSHAGSEACAWASYVAAISGIVYFPFALVDPLKSGLIELTAQLTSEVLLFFHVPVSIDNGNILTLDGKSVEIILACTAIESIALFAGVVLSVRAQMIRKMAALLLSTASIYILNIFRNCFVIMAYGWSWFGSDSFDIAHNSIAKIGSVAALLIISYFVFRLLPEVVIAIDKLAWVVKHPCGDAA